MAVDAFYRDANTLLYADNKPSDEAIDLLISKINQESVPFIVSSRGKYPDHSLCSVDKKAKFSRKRHNEDDGDITYINERNRVFNKKASTDCFPSIVRLTLSMLSDCKIL